MASGENSRVARMRLILFAAVTALHITVVLCVVVPMKAAVMARAEPAATGVMKLVDVREESNRPLPLPLPEEPPSPPPSAETPFAEPPPEGVTPQEDDTLPRGGPIGGGPIGAQELIAENMVETTLKPPPAVLGGGGDGSGIGTGSRTGGGGIPGGTGSGQIVYLPQHQISKIPELPEAAIGRAIVYPPIARRSNKEGIAYLELFIDRQGNIRQVNIVREDPPGWGFGEAAVNAFKGKKAKPGELNGQPVAVRYRYPVRFTLK